MEGERNNSATRGEGRGQPIAYPVASFYDWGLIKLLRK